MGWVHVFIKPRHAFVLSFVLSPPFEPELHLSKSPALQEELFQLGAWAAMVGYSQASLVLSQGTIRLVHVQDFARGPAGATSTWLNIAPHPGQLGAG